MADPTSIGGHTRADLDVIDWSKPLTESRTGAKSCCLRQNQFESCRALEDSREYARDLGDLFQKEFVARCRPPRARSIVIATDQRIPKQPRQLFKALEEEGASWMQLRDPWTGLITRFATKSSGRSFPPKCRPGWSDGHL